jgi:hypothetical protein
MAMAIRNAQGKSQTQVPAARLPLNIASIQSFKALMPHLVGNQSPKLFRKALKLFLKPVGGVLKHDSLVNVNRQKALINALPKQSEGDRFKAFQIIIANEELLGEDIYTKFHNAIQNSTQKSGAEQIADLFSQSAVAQPVSSQKPPQYQQHRAAAGQAPNVSVGRQHQQTGAVAVNRGAQVNDQIVDVVTEYKIRYLAEKIVLASQTSSNYVPLFGKEAKEYRERLILAKIAQIKSDPKNIRDIDFLLIGCQEAMKVPTHKPR